MSTGYVPWNHPAERNERPCPRDDELDLSYGQFAPRVTARSGQLAELGATRGDPPGGVHGRSPPNIEGVVRAVDVTHA